MARKYNMKNRAVLAENTTANIIAATEKLLAARSLDNINLKAIANEADTTVQTVLRHMRSREGCLAAVAHKVALRVEQQRGKKNYSNIEDAISDLIDHYELEGKLVLNLLAQEHSGESFAAEVIEKGRNYHRKWVQRCFGNRSKENNREIIDSLVVATDIYSWKILRLDLKRSKNYTKIAMTRIVKKILEE